MKTFSERVYQVVKKIPKGKVLTYLDAYLENDKNSRVAIEVMGGHNLITINGEVTSKSEIDVEKIVKNVYKEL